MQPSSNTAPSSSLRVLLLAGGPDSERDVSLDSAKSVAAALEAAGHCVHREIIDAPDAPALHALAAARRAHVIFPVLHGPWGEGGPLQDILETTGLPFVGCRAQTARLAMDKLATKLAAAQAAIPTLPACALNARDAAPPLGLPCVVKPIHEGSSVGVHICRTLAQWQAALAAIDADRALHPTRVFMVERAALGARELTVAILDGQSLPIIEIKPNLAAGVDFYDYQAKYSRDDTTYVIAPTLPDGLTRQIQHHAVTLAQAINVRHLSRIDFLLDHDNHPWLLEVNTLPGFTSHSLFPMAARAQGLDFPALTDHLVRLALRDHPASHARAC